MGQLTRAGWAVAATGALAAGMLWWPVATVAVAAVGVAAAAAGLLRTAAMLLIVGVLLAAAGVRIDASDRPGAAAAKASGG